MRDKDGRLSGARARAWAQARRRQHRTVPSCQWLCTAECQSYDPKNAGVRRRGGITSASDCMVWWIRFGYSVSTFAVAMSARVATSDGDSRPAHGSGAHTPSPTSAGGCAADADNAADDDDADDDTDNTDANAAHTATDAAMFDVSDSVSDRLQSDSVTLQPNPASWCVWRGWANPYVRERQGEGGGRGDERARAGKQAGEERWRPWMWIRVRARRCGCDRDGGRGGRAWMDGCGCDPVEGEAARGRLHPRARVLASARAGA